MSPILKQVHRQQNFFRFPKLGRHAMHMSSNEQEQNAGSDAYLYDWQEACYLAIHETDPAKIPGRVRAANEAIQRRLSRIEPWPDGREMRLLNEAVQSLRALRNRDTC
jgi:hypothetical protein